MGVESFGAWGESMSKYFEQSKKSLKERLTRDKMDPEQDQSWRFAKECISLEFAGRMGHTCRILREMLVMPPHRRLRLLQLLKLYHSVCYGYFNYYKFYIQPRVSFQASAGSRRTTIVNDSSGTVAPIRSDLHAPLFTMQLLELERLTQLILCNHFSLIFSYDIFNECV